MKYIYFKLVYFVKWFLASISKNWVLNAINKNMRPWIWKVTGVNVHGKFRVGYDVYYDVDYARYITIEDGVYISSRALLLCHKRDVKDYYIGIDPNESPKYIISKIHLKKNCFIGMGAIVMPGVTIGEGSVIGAGALVTKDIPDWSVAVGNPARVIRTIPQKDNNDELA